MEYLSKHYWKDYEKTILKFCFDSSITIEEHECILDQIQAEIYIMKGSK